MSVAAPPLPFTWAEINEDAEGAATVVALMLLRTRAADDGTGIGFGFAVVAVAMRMKTNGHFCYRALMLSVFI